MDSQVLVGKGAILWAPSSSQPLTPAELAKLAVITPEDVMTAVDRSGWAGRTFIGGRLADACEHGSLRVQQLMATNASAPRHFPPLFQPDYSGLTNQRQFPEVVTVLGAESEPI